MEPLESSLDACGQRFDRERFGQALHAFEQNVAIREETEQEPINEVFLADNDVTNLLAESRNPLS